MKGTETNREANRGQSPISAERSRISNPEFFRRAPNGTLTPNSQNGFTYLGILIIVMVMGAGLAATGTFWSSTAQREKERELLFIGNEFRQAIESYYRRSPGASVYPKSLAELLDDKRFPMPQHHLRRIYADPMTGKPEWGLVEAPGGAGIMGVHSLSTSAPVKTGNFATADKAFEEARKYSDWQFIYAPKSPVARN
jgi:type II secretory pathway pseudopilin PulG